MQTRIDIPSALLSHPVKLAASYKDFYCSKQCRIYRCIMCGAGDNSMNHPDYCNWVCFVIMHDFLFVQLPNYLYMYVNNANNTIVLLILFQISCDQGSET